MSDWSGNVLSVTSSKASKNGRESLKRIETAKETLMYRTVLWTLWERERMGRFGRMALKHVKYHV